MGQKTCIPSTYICWFLLLSINHWLKKEHQYWGEAGKAWRKFRNQGHKEADPINIYHPALLKSMKSTHHTLFSWANLLSVKVQNSITPSGISASHSHSPSAALSRLFFQLSDCTFLSLPLLFTCRGFFKVHLSLLFPFYTLNIPCYYSVQIILITIHLSKPSLSPKCQLPI